MLLLVTDTSGKHGSVGLVRAGDDAGNRDIRLIESVPLAGGTFSAQLVPQISGLLAKHGLSKHDLDVFVVISGPGSFTGLRVGLAAIKALAEILQKPVVPVSLLEAVAITAGVEGNVLAALDAGRGEIYVGEYEVLGDGIRARNEQLVPKIDLSSAARGFVVSTPDPGLADLAQQVGLQVQLVAPGADAIAKVGYRKLQAGETVTPEQLEANYIRRSDAEIFSKPRPGS
jgi:tRNA threonylcarbamoyladenosine biosynthesis protein TsaB